MNMLFNSKTHHLLYVASLAILAASVPVSVFMMSVSQFMIIGNWILEGDFKMKWTRFLQHKNVLIFISIFLLHIIWLFPPQDYHYALNDIRIKLPILILPFFIITSKPISYKELRFILYAFVTSVLAMSFIILYRYIYQDKFGITNYRELSPFISHIRYSLMVVFSVFILIYYRVINQSSTLIQKLFTIVIILYLTAFLFILRANTGIVALGLLLIIIFIYYLRKSRMIYKVFGVTLLMVGIAWICMYSYQIWESFIQGSNLLPPYSVVYTPNGNPYSFIPESNDVENGNRVWFYVQENELRKAWNNRCPYAYDKKDKRGNELKFTLIRYLTSKNLTKDSLGVSKLTNDDISAIEKGIPNYRFTQHFSLYPFIYPFLWEYYSYQSDGNANGHSLIQRIVYVRTAFSIIKKHFFFGVGTGNVQQAFNMEYSTGNTSLEKEYWHRAHNQYLTFFLTFGIFGFLWFCFAFFYPFFKNLRKNRFLPLIFLAIALISFVNEDTLETQAGVTFIILFYVLFAFGNREEELKI
jgi:hypothetical protein